MPSAPLTPPRVVVTGMGALTPVGDSARASFAAVLAGRSGVATLTEDWVEAYGLTTGFAARTTPPSAELLPKHEAKRLDPSGRLAVVAARAAVADAGDLDVAPERLAVVCATGIGGLWTTLDSWETLRTRGARRVLPLTVPMLMPNSSAAAVSMALGARAGAHSPVSACASGAEAVAMGWSLIRSGRADVVVAGGTEACVHPLTLATFGAMKALSTRNDDPQRASRPYDTARDGFVMGDGAGLLVLESAERAAARGARVYAELAGVGLSADAYDIAAPEPDGAGASRAMREALATGGVGPADVVHVNAHATSTPVGDVAEVRALRGALGAHADHAPVSATKSMTGHLLGAAGAVESIFTVLALHQRLAPAAINITDLDPAVDLDVVVGAPRPLEQGVALNNAFGFGGHNVALAFASV